MIHLFVRAVVARELVQFGVLRESFHTVEDWISDLRLATRRRSTGVLAVS